MTLLNLDFALGISDKLMDHCPYCHGPSKHYVTRVACWIAEGLEDDHWIVFCANDSCNVSPAMRRKIFERGLLLTCDLGGAYYQPGG